MSEAVQNNRNVCLKCGSTALEMGYLDSSNGLKVRFQIEKSGFLGFRLRNGPKVRARCCTVCGELQLFVDNIADY